MVAWLMNLEWDAILQIIIIDILLGGDNAVVIALACRNLPAKSRRLGIIWGAAGAIVLRVILITVAVALLNLPLLKLVGGVLLIWIGVKLLAPVEEWLGLSRARASLGAHGISWSVQELYDEMVANGPIAEWGGHRYPSLEGAVEAAARPGGFSKDTRPRRSPAPRRRRSLPARCSTVLAWHPSRRRLRAPSGEC